MTNRWNRFIYHLWAPIYDWFERLVMPPGRQRAMEVIDVQPGEKVLLVGVGTGADLPLLPAGVLAMGIDLNAEMLAQAREKISDARNDMLVQGDAQRLPLCTGCFDVAVLNLVLSVVPDGAACFRETVRALKPDGRIVVFDKFLPDGVKPTLARKVCNLGTMFFGTDITRCLGDMTADCRYVVVHDEASLLNGMYRVIVMRSGLEHPLEV
jgi:ubiquinone/menaquinone biosynthesis C-methylase UbiE